MGVENKVRVCGLLLNGVGVYIVSCELKLSLPVDFFFFLTLIKSAVLLSIIPSSSLSVCLLDWQPSYIPLLLYVLFCSFTTQWSVSVPKLRCSPFLNHCRPASCILHGTLPSIMRGGSGLGTSCQSACVCMSVCTYEAETEYVCVPIWTQTGSSIRASATTIEE